MILRLFYEFVRACVNRLHQAVFPPKKRPGPEAMRRSAPCTTIGRDVGDAVRTQRSGGQPEYEPIRAACNNLGKVSRQSVSQESDIILVTNGRRYVKHGLHQWPLELVSQPCRDAAKVARDVCAAPKHSLREALYCVCVSLVIISRPDD